MCVCVCVCVCVCIYIYIYIYIASLPLRDAGCLFCPLCLWWCVVRGAGIWLLPVGCSCLALEKHVHESTSREW